MARFLHLGTPSETYCLMHEIKTPCSNTASYHTYFQEMSFR
jgi:hypothetical protein